MRLTRPHLFHLFARKAPPPAVVFPPRSLNHPLHSCTQLKTKRERSYILKCCIRAIRPFSRGVICHDLKFYPSFVDISRLPRCILFSATQLRSDPETVAACFWPFSCLATLVVRTMDRKCYPGIYFQHTLRMFYCFSALRVTVSHCSTYI